MILDAFLTFSGAVSALGAPSGQLVTSTGNTLSTNTLDIASLSLGGNQAGDMGSGEPLHISVSVLQTLTSGGAATVQIQLIQADDAALTSNVQVLTQTDAFAYTGLTAGTIVPIKWDRAAPYTPKRYIGVRYVVGTAALTNATGQFFTVVAKDVQDIKNLYYKSGYTIL